MERVTWSHVLDPLRLAKVHFRATAPVPGPRAHSCTDMEAMSRGLVMKALEGGVVTYREIVEGVCEFGMGLSSCIAVRGLSNVLQTRLMDYRKRQSQARLAGQWFQTPVRL